MAAGACNIVITHACLCLAQDRQLPFTGMQAVRPIASACLQASTYLNKLPERFESDDKILISDPMLATGEAAAQQP